MPVQLAAKEPPSNRRRFDRELRSAAPHFPPCSLPGDALIEDLEYIEPDPFDEAP